jgi:GAF domain-containing protein
MEASDRGLHCRLCELCESLAGADERAELLKGLVEGCVEVMGAKACLVRVLDEKRRMLGLGASTGLSDRYLSKGPVEVDASALDTAVVSGESVQIEDIAGNERGQYPEEAAREGLGGMLSVPLCVKGRCVGVLRVYHDHPHRFTEEEQGLAKTLATHTGIALERLRLLNQTAALGEVAQAISSSLDRATVLSTIVRQAAEVLGFKGASIRLLDEDGNTLELQATHGMSDDYMSKGPVEVEKSPLDQAALSGREVVVHEADMSAQLQYPEDARREGIQSILCLPLSVRGRPVGVLRVYSSTPYPFAAEDIDFLKSLGNQGAIAIENARLFEHLRRDYEDLTRDVWKWYDWGERPPRT